MVWIYARFIQLWYSIQTMKKVRVWYKWPSLLLNTMFYLKISQWGSNCNTWNSCLGQVSREKKLLFFWILSKLPPPFPNLDNLYNFLNAKNVDLSDIQNDSLSKILLKLRQITCFVGHVYNLKNSLEFKLLAFWRK